MLNEQCREYAKHVSLKSHGGDAVLRAGDAVYLNTAGDEHPRIIRVDKLWTNPAYDFACFSVTLWKHTSSVQHTTTYACSNIFRRKSRKRE